MTWVRFLVLGIAGLAGVSAYAEPRSRPPLLGHTRPVFSVAFSSDGYRLASGGAEGSVRIWNIDRGQEIVTLTNREPIAKQLCFSPNAEELVAAQVLGIKIWEVVGWNEKRRNIGQGSRYGIGALFSRDGKHIITTYNEWEPKAGESESVRLGGLQWWDAMTGQRSHLLKAKVLWKVEYLALSRDGKLMVTGSSVGEVIVWDLEAKKELRRWQAHKLNKGQDCMFGVAISPDNNFVATAGTEPVLALWELATDKEVAVLKTGLSTGLSVEFSPTDPKTLVATGDSGQAEMWDIEKKEIVSLLKGHEGPIRCVAFSHDGKRVATGSDDKTIRIWDLSDK